MKNSDHFTGSLIRYPNQFLNGNPWSRSVFDLWSKFLSPDHFIMTEKWSGWYGLRTKNWSRLRIMDQKLIRTTDYFKVQKIICGSFFHRSCVSISTTMFKRYEFSKWCKSNCNIPNSIIGLLCCSLICTNLYIQLLYRALEGKIHWTNNFFLFL